MPINLYQPDMPSEEEARIRKLVSRAANEPIIDFRITILEPLIPSFQHAVFKEMNKWENIIYPDKQDVKSVVQIIRAIPQFLIVTVKKTKQKQKQKRRRKGKWSIAHFRLFIERVAKNSLRSFVRAERKRLKRMVQQAPQSDEGPSPDSEGAFIGQTEGDIIASLQFERDLELEEVWRQIKKLPKDERWFVTVLLDKTDPPKSMKSLFRKLKLYTGEDKKEVIATLKRIKGKIPNLSALMTVETPSLGEYVAQAMQYKR